MVRPASFARESGTEYFFPLLGMMPGGGKKPV